MKVYIDTIVLFIAIIVYIGFDVYTAKQTHNRLESYITETDSMAYQLLYRTANMQARIDSLKTQNKALAETVVYLDSCSQNKAFKTERAERRGRFLGGLIKGLFPKL